MSMNDALDAVQDLSDSKWEVLLASADDAPYTQQENDPDHSPALFIFTRAAEYAELSRISSALIETGYEYAYSSDAACFFSKKLDSCMKIGCPLIET